MKQQNPQLIRAVDWPQVCPWLLLTKAMRLGFSYRLLFVMTVHLIVCALLLGWAFRWGEPKDGNFLSYSLRESSFVKAGESKWVLKASIKKVADSTNKAHEFMKRKDLLDSNEPTGLILDVEGLSQKADTDAAKTLTQANTKPLGGKILVAAYVIFSSVLLYMALARIMAVMVATDIRISTFQALRFALSRFRAGIAAVFFVAITLGITLLPIWGIGQLPSGLQIVTAPLGLLLSVLSTIILLAGIGGFPFVLSTIMVENSDCMDGLSRAYAYVFFKPLRLFFYLFFTVFFGILGFVAISIITVLVLFVFEYFSGSSPIIMDWYHAFGFVPWAYSVTFLFTAITGIYMLRRQDVDSVELEDIWLEEPQDVPAPHLPTLNP